MNKAELLKKLLSFGSQTAPEVIEEAAGPIAKRISTEAVEVGPQVIGKGTSKLRKEAAEEIPDAILSQEAELVKKGMNPKLAKIAVASGLVGGGAMMLGGKPPEIPMTPKSQEPILPDNYNALAQAEANDMSQVKTEAPKPNGLDADALVKEQATEPEISSLDPKTDLVSIMKSGIEKRDKGNFDANLLRAAEKLSAGLSRTTSDHGSSDIVRKQAGEAIEDAKNEIGAEKSQLDFNKLKDDLGDETKMRDPNSEISKMVTGIAQKVGILKSGQSSSAMDLKNAGVNLGTLLATMEAAKGRKEAAALAMMNSRNTKAQTLDEKQRKFVQGLRKEATTGVLGKQYATYSTGRRMSDSLSQFAKDPSGYKDYATLMGGLKSLQGDESVVREAEVRLGMNATSAINKAMNYLQSAATGKQLQPEQRQEMVDTINILTEASRQQYMHSAAPILEQAQMEGIDPGLILSGSLSGAKKTEETSSQYSPKEEAGISSYAESKGISREQAIANLKAGGRLK